MEYILETLPLKKPVSVADSPFVCVEADASAFKNI